MKDRRQVTRDLEDFQARLKELEIRYEQYFAGVEKREPYRQRTDLAREIRHYNPQLIPQTDLKFRYHGLASRLASYSQYWDRILRLMDEGKYHRHLTSPAKQPAGTEPARQSAKASEADQLHQDLIAANKECGVSAETPSVEKISRFLDVQRQKISEKFGDRAVEFLVDTSQGKPRIKARLKQ